MTKGKPHPLLVILTAVWRLCIAIIAFAGWWLYGHDPAELPFLTQSGNLLVSIVYLGLVVYYPAVSLATGREPGSGKIRGAMALLMMVVGCTYVGVMGGDIDNPADLLAHVVTPLLVFLDWCFVGRSQNRTRWWHPFLWLIIPGVWLIGYSLTGGYRWVRGSSPLYGFADPRDGEYVLVVVGLVLATITGGFLLFGIGKTQGAPVPGHLRGAGADRSAAGALSGPSAAALSATPVPAAPVPIAAVSTTAALPTQPPYQQQPPYQGQQPPYPPQQQQPPPYRQQPPPQQQPPYPQQPPPPQW